MGYCCITALEELRAYLSGASPVAFDFETAPDENYRDEERAALNAHKSHIVDISFSVAENSGVYIPLTHRIGQNAEMLTELWQWLMDEFFLNLTVTKVAHNLSFEAMFLYARGIVVQAPVYDTIAASQMTLKSNTAFRTLGDSGLKTLVPELLGIELPSFGEVTRDAPLMNSIRRIPKRCAMPVLTAITRYGCITCSTASLTAICRSTASSWSRLNRPPQCMSAS